MKLQHLNKALCSILTVAAPGWLSNTSTPQILREHNLLQILLLPSKLRCTLRELKLFQQFYLFNLMAPLPSWLLFAIAHKYPWEDCTKLCEGKWSPTTTKMRGYCTYLFNIIGMKTFGHNKLIKLINSLVSHHELVELNCLIRLIKLFKLNKLII